MTSVTLSHFPCLTFGHLILKYMHAVITPIDTELMSLGHDLCSYIGIHKLFGHLKLFTEDVQFPVPADKPDKMNRSIRDILNLWHSGIQTQSNRRIPFPFNNLCLSLPVQATVPVMGVMEPLKMLALSLQRPITGKPLSAKELLVVGVVKTLYDPIAPWFTSRNKYRLDTII